MLTYVGWVPTALGRLSFTTIGDHFQRRSVVSRTVDEGRLLAVFGIRHRRSNRGGGGFVQLFRARAFDFAFFLSPVTAPLPVPNGKPQPGPLTDLSVVEAKDGALKGTVYFVQRAGIKRGRLALSGLTYLRDQAVLANAEGSWSGDTLERFHAAKSRVKAVWRLQRQKTRSQGWDHEFGTVDVLLLRTGECRLSIDRTEQALWIKLDALGVVSRLSDETLSHLDMAISKAAAEVVFLAVRDVAHKHYHHSGDRAVDGPVTLLTEADDETWRRRTLEGLMRMCIGLRRKGSASALRHSLGVLAYVDAFDRHLAKWSMKNGEPKPIRNPTFYDLSALKNSLDAALKVRELDDQGVRNRLLFIFGLIVTTITVVAPAYRELLRTDAVNVSFFATPFLWLIRAMINQPIFAIALAGFIGWAIDKGVNYFSQHRPGQSWRAWRTRSTNTAVAWARAITAGSRAAQGIVLFITILLIFGCVVIWWSIFSEFAAATLNN